MQSRLDSLALILPTGCLAGRSVASSVYYTQQGSAVTLTYRNKLLPDDLLHRMAKAYLFSLQAGSTVVGRPPSRLLRELLVQNKIVQTEEEAE